MRVELIPVNGPLSYKVRTVLQGEMNALDLGPPPIDKSYVSQTFELLFDPAGTCRKEVLKLKKSDVHGTNQSRYLDHCKPLLCRLGILTVYGQWLVHLGFISLRFRENLQRLTCKRGCPPEDELHWTYHAVISPTVYVACPLLALKIQNRVFFLSIQYTLNIRVNLTFLRYKYIKLNNQNLILLSS